MKLLPKPQIEKTKTPEKKSFFRRLFSRKKPQGGYKNKSKVKMTHKIKK